MTEATERRYYTSAQACDAAGVTPRQLYHWVRRGYVDARYKGKGGGCDDLHPPVGDFYGRTGFTLVLNTRSLAVLIALGVVASIAGQGAGALKRVSDALDRWALDDWGGHTLVVRGRTAVLDGPIGTGALVVDLGACLALAQSI